TAGTAPSSTDATPAAPRRPRAARGIPKSDAVLEAASERARLGVLEVVPEAQVGRHVSAVVEGERLVTHRFEAFVPGYGGGRGVATAARGARGKEVTVCEVGLLPSATSLIAPEWLPWSERVRPEDSQPEEQPDAGGVDGAPVVGADELTPEVGVPGPAAGGPGGPDAASTGAGEVPDRSDTA
ncbi:DUF3027 domain-containing protein, partial [Arthrobacter sp. RIT-PI-e]|uniref:DUF3027 domain-containing protein n=1 Tax=Arthrobacter sp. RIT-PI-e TaxID=1681197 RepID=UPI000675BE7B